MRATRVCLLLRLFASLRLEVEAKRPENFVEKLQGKLPMLALLARADDGTIGHDVGLHERAGVTRRDFSSASLLKLRCSGEGQGQRPAAWRSPCLPGELRPTPSPFPSRKHLRKKCQCAPVWKTFSADRCYPSSLLIAALQAMTFIPMLRSRTCSVAEIAVVENTFNAKLRPK